MKKVLCFLHDKGVIDIVLESALDGGMEEARHLGATNGAIAAAIIIDGELCLKSKALEYDVIKENNHKRPSNKEPETIINYVGHATIEIMKSVHTMTPPFGSATIIHEKSDDNGSDREIYFCKNHYGEESTFMLLTAYSGVGPINHYQVARTACCSAWLKMKDYKNPDGSSIGLRSITSVSI